MISDTAKWRVLAWVPLVLSVLISAAAFAQYLDTGRLGASFIILIPICFYFVGSGVSQMRGDVVELQKQVAELQAIARAQGHR